MTTTRTDERVAEAAELQQTYPARARRWLRRTAALLATAPLLAGALQLPQAPAAHAAPKATGARTVDVAINSLTPAAPSAGDTITVRGIVTNDGDSTISDAQVAFRLGSLMGGRSAIDTAAKRGAYTPGLDGTEISGKYAKKVGKLPSGVSRDFTLNIPVEQLHLPQSGVYQIGVSLSGRTASSPWQQQVLGFQRTFLPWQPGDTAEQSRTTFLWPLISTTHIAVRPSADTEQTPIFRNDDLLAEMSPGGRLQQMVALGEDRPVTWVIDPDLLATADAMTREYKILDGEQEQPKKDSDAEDGEEAPPPATRDGKGQAVARKWLGDLQKAVQGHDVVALPFADPDLASLAHHGRGATGALKSATTLADTVETILNVKPRTDFAWPVDGGIDRSVVKLAGSIGARNIITRSDSLRENGGLAYTPSAPRKIGGGKTAIVSDARLSTAFTDDMSKAENATLAVQEFLAQSQMITLQAPAKQRSVVVAPQRMPTAGQAQAMAKALDALKPGHWATTEGLTDAATATPDPNATTQVPDTSQYRGSLRRQELPSAAFQDIQRTRERLDNFKVILSNQDRVVTPFTNAIARELSTSWRGSPRDAGNFRGSVGDYLDTLMSQVSLIPKSTTRLSGRSATIPVTVHNNLTQSVKGLTLRITSNSDIRLAVSGPQQVNVEAGHSQSVKFGATANANGRAQIKAQLYTEDGRPYGEAMTFEVKVTEITSTVILVIAVGVLLLVLAGIRIYIKRKRRTPVTEGRPTSGGQEGAEADEPTGAAHSEDTDVNGTAPAVPQQAGDPVADTGSQSAGPSGSGEKVDH